MFVGHGELDLGDVGESVQQPRCPMAWSVCCTERLSCAAKVSTMVCRMALPARRCSRGRRRITPDCADGGGENAVFGFLQRGVRIFDIAFESRVGAFEDDEIVEAGFDSDCRRACR